MTSQKGWGPYRRGQQTHGHFPPPGVGRRDGRVHGLSRMKRSQTLRVCATPPPTPDRPLWTFSVRGNVSCNVTHKLR